MYTLRVNMSVAAQEMREELNWDEEQKGLVLVRLPSDQTLNKYTSYMAY